MNDKNKNIIVTIIFSSFIIILSIFNIMKKDENISISERRKLEQFPTFSFSNLFNGTFFEKFDKYTTDQFIKRDEFRKLKVDIELATKGNYNGLFTYNDYIIKTMYPLNKSSIVSLTNKINYIKDNYLNNNNIYFTIIPDKNYFVPNLKIDYNELENIMKQNLSDITYIDIFPLLKLENYYKTDTHWKQETLTNIALKLASSMNFNISNSFTEKELTSFNGVYSSQLPINTSSDAIKILTNNVIQNSHVYNYETKETTDIYDMTKINSLDKYDVYLSGSTPLITITNDLGENKELIIFRDSYASSLVPLLTEGYKKITLVDTRYISSKVLNEFIDFDNKDILFMYSTLLINDSSSIR
ncbi:MAG: hypothetical protein MR227_04495 [Firmicutes bacterium]|nr:hypothetical protein [Bacillota bacterium]